MILAFCFCTRDQDLALKNLQWWNELGGCKGHTALVGYDPRCDAATVEAIRQEFVKAFDKVFKLNILSEVDGWPEGANYFMRVAAVHLQDRQDHRYFFWMEPDAVPLRPGWLDAIEAEYKASGKAFMGDRVEVKIDGKEVPLHMSGIGVYWNPLHQKAGEAYRAHDIAWDMAAAEQIVPQAHFTKLIEHAWKHPSFTHPSELGTQIRPEAVLFHSSKDGSLIRLLRAQKNLSGSRKAEDRTGNLGASPDLREILPPQKEPHLGNGIGKPSAQPVYDIFIRTYAPDYDWLRYCIESIDKFASGFRKVWIISPHNPPIWMLERTKGPVSSNPYYEAHFGEAGIPIDWRVMNEEAPDGYLSQQIHKLYADVITDYGADYYLHIDSDVILTQPITPKSFFVADKVIWPFTPYAEIQTPWQPITQSFLNRMVENEFMRRFPIMVPKWLYGKLREFAHHQHGRIISDYIRTQPNRAFSEFNALGAYAYEFHHDKFAWFNTTTEPLPEPFGKQYHSWSGMSPEIKAEIETILGGDVQGTAKASAQAFDSPVINHLPPPVLADLPDGTNGVAPSAHLIKKLPNDIWVLEGDQISGWVEQEGRLDHDQNLLPYILQHIKPGDTVIDVGAFIGDHTIAYARTVGSAGQVYAFEPNPHAYRCLKHNLREHPNVMPFFIGLSDKSEVVPLSGNNGNWGGAYVGDHMPITSVKLMPLDDYQTIEPDFIKIDVEGYEVKVLQGATGMITLWRPKMMIEINPGALGRQGYAPEDIFAWLKDHDYTIEIIQQNCTWTDPMYDVLCLPIPKPVTAAPLVAGISTPEEMLEYVDRLKSFSDSSPRNKQLLMQRLVRVGLKKPNQYRQKYKKRHDKIPAIFKKKKT